MELIARLLILSLLFILGNCIRTTSPRYLCDLPESVRYSYGSKAVQSHSLYNNYEVNSTLYAKQSQIVYNSFISNYYREFGSPLYSLLLSNSNGSIIQPTQYWNLALGINSLLDYHNNHYINSTAAILQAEALINLQNYAGWSRDYYDDMNWMNLMLLELYAATASTKYYHIANQIFMNYTVKAWDTSCCIKGAEAGIWWDTKHTQKATAINAGAVISAIRFATINKTYDTFDYVAFATKVYDYWALYMFNATSGLVRDDVTTDGVIHDYIFTYNQGLFLQASVELYQYTAEKHYLLNAISTATFLNTQTVTANEFGPVLSDCADSKLCNSGDCAQFKSIGYKYLLNYYELIQQEFISAVKADEKEFAQQLLSSVCVSRGVLLSSVNSLWHYSRNPVNNLFSCQWHRPVEDNSSPLQPQHNVALTALSKAASIQSFVINL
jgi:predicted alpha-1,6-mannanase (GH76 family)